ncbi:uncharacterized protein ATC70_002538 [Mucor velutinosus]|uniref:Nuclear condensin complex subunit 3 C-terminal domain-containing protein n=1 Tax=Mucor velutinosus TaxID=708070 RepID=A0AAN7DHD4_9FUNG|nr:hypothetical protein ATC70_002538 [Mucor velutinosus]
MVKRKAPVDPNLLEQSTYDKKAALDNMKENVVEIFMTAQQPDAVLRAESIKLRDVQIGCCYNSPRRVGEPESIDYEAEADFLKLIFKMVNIVIKAKRKEPTADRVQRFIAVFLQYIQTKDEEAKSKARKKRRGLLNTTTPTQPSASTESTTKASQKNDADVEMQDDKANQEAEAKTAQAKKDSITEEDQDDEEDDHEDQSYETITSRFVERLLKYLFQGFSDARASVRVRCCHIIALCISSMGELDEDLYQELKRHLFEGHIDREASVRAQAVTALCRLQSDTEIDPLDGQTIHEKLMWSVRHDPSSEVRRLILFNIDVTSDAIPYVVKSIRDPDDTNRRVVYLKTLSNLEDFRLLSFEERQQVLKWGLNDRSDLVRKAATKMFAENWIKHAGRNLIEFLERLEATKPQMSELIEKLFKEFFKIRSDVFNESVFDDEFWTNLSGESALLARLMIEYLQNENEEDERLDKLLPSVTVHAMNLENYYNLYQQYNNTEDNAFNYEYIVVQMLDIALCLDYADEVGRRKMFNLLRDILRAYEVVDSHLERILKVFRRISIDERDFTRSIIEIISDIQEEASIPYLDMEDDVATKRAKLDDNSSSSSVAEAPKSTTHTEEVANSQDVPNPDLDKLVAKLRCLSICRRMLENSYEPLTDNSILYGLLNDLVVPAVQDGDSLLRQEGLHCLGLCCTLDKGLAQHNVGLFINCIRNGHEVLVKIAVRTLGDMLLMYGIDAMSEHLSNTLDIRNVFEFGLDHDNTEIQSLTTQSLCKLMLFNRYTDDELLRLMVLLYFFPKTDMDEHSNMIHQCLAYFFPAYCFSSLEHQKSLSGITIAALEELCNIFADLEKDENMTNPKQIAEMLADWNDPRKLTKTQANIRASPEEQDFTEPGKLALKALTIIYIEEEGLLRKAMLTFVTRLYLNEADKLDLIEIKKQIIKINEEKPLKLQPARKALNKIVETIDSIVDFEEEQENDKETAQQDKDDASNEKQIEHENAEQGEKEDEDQDSDNGSSVLGSNFDHQIELSDDDGNEKEDQDAEDEDEDEDEDSPPPPSRRQPQVVRRRISKIKESEDEDEDEDEEEDEDEDEESEGNDPASEYEDSD